MRLEHFERLQKLVQETTDLLIKLKFENIEIKEKYEKLEEKLKNGNDKTVRKLKRLEEENFLLKQQQEKATSRLMHLRTKVRSITEGVES